MNETKGRHLSALSILGDSQRLTVSALPRRPKLGELLFEFVRASDHAPMSCELRFNGESYGWEAQFFERGDLVFAHGGFPLRAMAVAWAESMRADFSVPANRST